MTAVSGEKTVLKSKVKIGRVRWSILAMLFVVTTVNYADRSTLSIAGSSRYPDGICACWSACSKGRRFAIVLWSAFTMAQGAILERLARQVIGRYHLPATPTGPAATHHTTTLENAS